MAARSAFIKVATAFVVGGVIGMIFGALWIGPERVGDLSEGDLAAIRELSGPRLEEILMAEDWAGFAAAFTGDAVRMPPNEALHQGRATIEAWATSNWGPLTMTEYSQEALEIDGAGDIAFARLSYSALAEVPGMPEPVAEVGKGIVILRKQPDGSWLVSHAIYNSDQPLPVEGSESET
jgi:ketosteroid isomerase-like protein